MKIRGKKFELPIFLPDATRAVVRSVDSVDIAKSRIEGMVVNTFHLMENPGRSIIKNLGGVKKMMNWDGLIVSDSGGFQVMSLIHAGKVKGKMKDEGVLLGNRKKDLFSPAKSIAMQMAIGSDIMVVLDDCPSNDADEIQLRESVERTIVWAGMSKVAFEKEVKAKKWSEEERPLLLAVAQGGDDVDLRRECTKRLFEIGFDGVGFGGWPVDAQGKLKKEALQAVVDETPEGKILFGLGIGKPDDIVRCWEMGYTIFDCVLPTRDARHGRLYAYIDDPQLVDLSKKFYNYVYLTRGKYVRDQGPISQYCDCHTCLNYSRAYITHLFKIGDSLAWRLATIHNLRFYSMLMERLRK